MAINLECVLFAFSIALLVIANCYSVKLVVRVIAVLSVLKLIAVGFVVALGVITVARTGDVSEDIHHPFRTYGDLQLTPSSLALSLYSVMFAYDGWYVYMCMHLCIMSH